VDEKGTWEADGVPVSAYGTAIIDVEVYAGNGSNFAHHNLRFTPLDSPPAGNSIGSHISNQPQPVAVKMASYFFHKSWAVTTILSEPDMTIYTGNVPVFWPGYVWIHFNSGDNIVNWAAGVGGTQHYYGYSDDYPGYFDGLYEIGPNQSDAVSWGISTWESANVTGTFPGNSTGGWSKFVRTRVVIAPVGQEPAGQTNSYLVRASALAYADSTMNIATVPVPPEWLQIN